MNSYKINNNTLILINKKLWDMSILGNYLELFHIFWS